MNLSYFKMNYLLVETPLRRIILSSYSELQNWCVTQKPLHNILFTVYKKIAHEIPGL